MNITFLILIALPLGVYLLALLLQTREIGAEDKPRERAQNAAVVLADESVVVETVAPGMDERAVNEPSASIEIQETVSPNAPAPIAASAAPDVIETHSVIVQELASAPDAKETRVDAVAERVDAPVSETQSSERVELATASDDARASVETALTEILPTQEINRTADDTEKIAPVVVAQESIDETEPEPILPEGPVILPEKGSPKFTFDYRGRLWIEKKRKGFFRQLRRPQLPPEDPS